MNEMLVSIPEPNMRENIHDTISNFNTAIGGGFNAGERGSVG